MNIYPYDYPLIMDVETYTNYGGMTGTATEFQLDAAFITAETRMTSFIGTFLLPTIVTGTYTYNRNNFLMTDYGYVNQILSASILSADGNTTCTLSETAGCAYIRDDTFGYIDYSSITSACGCGTSTPYKYQIAYEAGLPSGTASHPNMLQALTIVSEIALNEMQRPTANEGVGDVGIEKFTMGDEYREERKVWNRTALGDSARANYAAGLVKSVIRRAVKPLLMR